ncbi:MAG: hypothetical protein PSV23_12035 [Brevundimonas sp.]|uniref:hypothetical protein n=1 Tax=Brevundimonas sp. TaxID=1871086 RepID=UPI002488D704|nr:hypothetical protein [Brevundimonas sp.]MDI1327512.1 hypothetical protein [Brevundimonas sp.]
MLAVALAVSLLAASPDPGLTADMQIQEPAGAGPVALEDVVVEGRRLDDLTSDFVSEVAIPARGRGLARWRDGVCVGVANLKAETAQYIVDRVSTIAEDLGLKPGAPGCDPRILVIATTDANNFTRDFVANRPRLFRVGGAGMDLGRNALRKFESTDRPVRWWNVSVPIDSETGDIAVRIPGYISGDGTGEMSALQYAPNISVFAASRLSTQIVDDTMRSFVIVDVDRLNGVSLEQLADYIAFISLAQINPEADTSGYVSVLNVFDDPGQADGLTNWDRAYLLGLYDTVRTRLNHASQRTEIVSSILRVHGDLAAAEDAAAE